MRVTPWLGLMALGCGTGEGASYVVLDEPARAALIEVETGGRTHGGALPIEVEMGTPVDLITPTGRRPLRAEPGMVYEVNGPTAEVRAWTLGGDVRTDLMEVGGPATVVRNLASALGARVEPWNGRWRLEGPDALLRLSWMGEVADVSQVGLVLTETARGRAVAAWNGATPAVSRAVRQERPGDVTMAPLVGLYTSDAGLALFLDAEGGFALQGACDPAPVRGTYRLTDRRVHLDGTDLALSIDASGRLEAPGLVFFAGEEK